MARRDVRQDPQAGLLDEQIVDPATQEAVRLWYIAKTRAEGTNALQKAVTDAAKKVRDMLPAMSDGNPHRFVFVDELGPAPVQYEVNTRPGPKDKKVEFTRQFQARMTVGLRETPRTE